MLARRALARTIVLSTTVVTLAGVAATTPAFATTGTVTVASTNGTAGVSAWNNTSTASVVLTTSDTFLLAGLTVTFTRDASTATNGSCSGDCADKFTATVSSAAPATPSGTTVTVNADFASANPGLYDIDVTGTGTPNSQDICSNCFTVAAAHPTVTGVAAPGVDPGTSGSPLSIAQNGVATLTINGTGFAAGHYAGSNSNYACPATACTAPPTLAFFHGTTDESSSFTVADPSPFVATTTTTITRKLTVAGNTPTGLYDVVVTNTDGQSATCTGCLSVDPAMTITGVTPATIGQGASGRTIDVTGTNFRSDLAGTIVDPGTGTNGVSGTLSAPSSSTAVQFTNVAATSTAEAGCRQVSLTSEFQTVLTGTGPSCALTVDPAPAPSAAVTSTGSSPHVGVGATGVTMTITGTGFDSGATFSLANPTGITLDPNGFSESGTTTVTGTIASVGPTAATGDHVVTVTNSDGGTKACTCVVTIDAAPAVTSVSPAAAARGESVGTLTINGTGFGGGTPTVTIPGLSWTGLAVSGGNQITLTGTAVAADATPGARGITITNADDSGHSTTGTFSVNTLDVTGPSTTTFNDNPSFPATVTGNGFNSDAQVLLTKTGTGQSVVADIPATSVTFVDAHTLDATFNVSGIDPGTYAFKVVDPDGSINPPTGQGGQLDVVANPPTVQPASPASRGAGASHEPIEIDGTGFGPHAAVSFSNAAVQVDAGSLVITPTKITFTISIPEGTSADSGETVTVTNTDGQHVSTPFAVTAGPVVDTSSGKAPTPTARGANAADTTVTVSGQGGTFSGATLLFLIPGTTDAGGVTASGYSLTPGTFPVSDDVLTATLHTTSASPGTRDIVVVNSDGGRSTCAGCLTITAAPTVTSTTPAGGALGTTVTGVNITGTGFQSNPVVTVGGGITVSNVAFQSASLITADFAIPAGATRDSFATVTVTNADGGNGAYGDAATTGFHIFGVPDAPASVHVTPDSSALDVSWTAPASDGGNAVKSYTVTLTPQGGAALPPFTTSNGTTTTHQFTGLTPKTPYDVTVAATNDAGTGPTAGSSGTPYTFPAAPTNLTVTQGNGSLDLSWVAPTDDGGSAVTSYTATAIPNAGGSPVSSSGSATSQTLSGLTNGTLYDVSVVATNSAGDGAPVTGQGTPRTVPGAPTGLTLTPGNGALSVSWTAPTADGGNAVDRYTVSATPHSGGTTSSFDTADASTTSHTFTGLTNGSLYDVTVTAHNAAGSGAALAGTGTPRTVPGAPTAVTVGPGDGTLAVSWAAPTTDGGNAVDTYTVSVAPHAGGTPTTFTTSNATTTSHSFSSLTNGTLYDVTVTAHNAAGNGAAATGSGTPARSSDAPGIRNIVSGDASLTVAWAAPAANGGAAVSSYTVSVTPHAGGTTTTFTTPDATTTSHTFGGLTNGTLYDVSVAANNAAGRSQSASAAATPRWAATLTLTDTARKVVYGTKVTLSGQLTRSDGQPDAGASVRLFRTLDGGTAAVYRTLTTDAAGHWSTTFAPAANASYFASFIGDVAVSPATSGAARTTVAPRVRIWSPLNRSTSSSATVLRVTGKVAPNKAGRAVVLYYVTKTGRLVKLTAARLSSRSTYVLTYRLKRGTWRLRVVIGASSGNVAGTSSTLTVKRT